MIKGRSPEANESNQATNNKYAVCDNKSFDDDISTLPRCITLFCNSVLCREMCTVRELCKQSAEALL